MRLDIRTGLLLALPIFLTTGIAISTGSGPRIRFDKTTHDFGKMKSVEKKEYSWIFHNDGNLPLKIYDIKASCGCTVTNMVSTTVAPGGSSEMQVSFDASGYNGTVRKSIAVSTNDPSNPRILLTVRADVTLVAESEENLNGHPVIKGQSMFFGKCAECHAAPANGLHGSDLFGAVCSMCHGDRGQGGSAPSLRSPGYLESHPATDLENTLSYGTANPKMPGFSDIMGGPLTAEQVRSLVELIRHWEPESTE